MKKEKKYINRPVIDRNDVLGKIVDDCLDQMFRAAYPSITFEEYKKKHEGLTREEKQEIKFYEAHYLPWKVYKAIEDDFIDAYKLKSDLPSTIEVLKGYFKEPIVDKWIEKDDGFPGYRGYDHPEPMAEDVYKEAERFLDMANGFYNWNRDLNTFIFNVSNYSPCSNRETVERWWHEHGDPDFKIPDDSYWVDSWDDEDEDDDEDDIEE